MRRTTLRRTTRKIRQTLDGCGCTMAKKWIQSAIKRPGQLHRDLGVPQGKPIPAEKLREAAKRPGKVGKRARLALTLKGFKK